jgi:5-methylcytosine-specific restriction enzyme A
MPGGHADTTTLERGAGGRALCRWCRMEVPARRRTFCSDYCVHEWRLRTDVGYLRECVFERDHGVCAQCGTDTVAAWNHLKRLRRDRRALLLRQDWGIGNARRSSLWDADHVVPVAEGGGECDLSNIRTLCVRCHRVATAALAARLRKNSAQQTAGLNDA